MAPDAPQGGAGEDQAAGRRPYQAGGLGPRRDRRIGLVALGVVVLLVTASGLWFGLSRSLVVDLGSARRGLAVDSVYANGVVDYGRQAEIVSVVSAPIVAVLVTEGARVRRGQTLVQLEDGPQRAEAASRRADADLARAIARRTSRLARAGFAAPAAEEDAQARLAAATSALRGAEALAGFYRVRAPFDGVIVRRDAEPGELATPSKILFVLAEPTTLRITAEVDERDILGVIRGASVFMTSDAAPGRTLEGRVAEVTPRGDPLNRVFRVRVAVPQAAELRPGMTVDLNIVTARRPDATLIPSDAVTDDGVWLVREGRVARRRLALGAQGAGWTEVTRGLAPGDVVVRRPPNGLRDGRRVREDLS